MEISAFDEQASAQFYYCCSAQQPHKTQPRANRAEGPIPRFPLQHLETHAAEFLDTIRKHGFVVLSDIGFEGECLCQNLMLHLQSFFAQDDWSKARCTSKNNVYRSERGVPMWFLGYELDTFREAFRMQASRPDAQPWPSTDLKKSWLSLLKFVREICDKCLAIAIGKDFVPPSPYDNDYSVAYAVHYPNLDSTFDPYNPSGHTLNINEHCDPSLFVIEPCTHVQGLEILDHNSRSWIQVEQHCIPGKELILFGGKALQRSTYPPIPAAPHRVGRAQNQSRHVFIYEQKYESYFDAPVFD